MNTEDRIRSMSRDAVEEHRLHLEANRRTLEAQQAYRDYVAARNGDKNAREIQRVSDRPDENFMAAMVIIISAAVVGGAVTWAAHTLFTWLVRAAG